MNTLENAALLLPALWVNAGFVSDRGAAALGALWLISRIWYAIAYQSDPAKRGPSYGLSMTAFGITWSAAAWGIARVLMR
jgi:glutathione S-transferase